MREKLKRFTLWIVLFGFFGAFLAGFLLLLAILSLPKIETLEDYSPPLVTELHAKDGRIFAEYYVERRYLKQVDELPSHVVNAFVSAEDSNFFEHPGIDIGGIMRAAFANIKAGHVVQGGSTITQQVAKSLLLTSERSFSRKFKELLLAYKMESRLSKNQILYLYINQIYLGEGAYGIEAAARTYFRKSAKDLTIAEAAMIAGLVQAPSVYSPLHSPRKAKERQTYVLRRMFETGRISDDEYKKALATEVQVYRHEEINLKVAPYYAEYVRQHLISTYGQDALYKGGLNVQTAADYDLSITAMKSVRQNLRDLDKRQGYRGPLMHLASEQAMVEELRKIRREVIEKRFPFVILPTNEDTIKAPEYQEDEFTLKRVMEKEKITDEKKLLLPEEMYRAVVTRIDPDGRSATLLIGSIRASLSIRDMSWAKRITPPETANWAQISRVTEALHAGDVVLVRPIPVGNEKASDPMPVALEQDPLAQGALLSMEAQSGHVIAMVGGYDFAVSPYNRALQGERQPGSALKPFLYASALDKGFTPSSIIVDSPIIFENQGEGNLKWIPENHGEQFYGDTTFRTALINSRNVPAVKLLQEVQVPYYVNYLRALGVRGDINEDLSLALGSKTISLGDLTNLYALFPRLGMRIEPVFILKVTDRAGQLLEEYSFADFQREAAAKWLKYREENKIAPPSVAPESEEANAADPDKEKEAKMHRLTPPVFDDPLRAMDERTSFVMSHLLEEVVQSGTGTGARVLKRRVGGKTGTTSDYVDAWFMGFSPEVVTGSWVGFDTPRTLGRGEVGGRAALPAWVDYMQHALSVYKQDEFPVPKGVVFVRINPQTGNIAPPGSTNAVKEAYIEGTEPTAESSSGPQRSDSTDFFREDF